MNDVYQVNNYFRGDLSGKELGEWRCRDCWNLRRRAVNRGVAPISSNSLNYSRDQSAVDKKPGGTLFVSVFLLRENGIQC